VEVHFSFPGESTDFTRHAAPVISRLISAMGHAPRQPSVKSVHAVLLRAVLPERVGDTDHAVYTAMGVSGTCFTRWKRLLGELRAAAAPAEEAPGDDAQLGWERPGGQSGQVPTAATMPAAAMRAAAKAAAQAEVAAAAALRSGQLLEHLEHQQQQRTEQLLAQRRAEHLLAARSAAAPLGGPWTLVAPWARDQHRFDGSNPAHLVAMHNEQLQRAAQMSRGWSPSGSASAQRRPAADRERTPSADWARR